jgi:hypothetical protein
LILLVFYTISMVALSIPLIKLVIKLSPDHFYPLIATLLLYMVLVVVLGSVIHTISYIPSNLAGAFDPIKNDIASGRISDLQELGKRISLFMTKFFNFAFLDIDHAFLHTEKTGVVSCEDIPEAAPAMEEFGMLEKSKSIKEMIRAGKITHDQNEYHLYILPIWLGDQWLGYMGLMSNKRIGRFYQKFLTEFENNFLDDQLMHVSRSSQSIPSA